MIDGDRVAVPDEGEAGLAPTPVTGARAGGFRPARRWLPVGVAAAVAMAGGAAGWAISPHGPVASGCFWWTAKRVGDAAARTSGCVRGYVRAGGALAEGPTAQDFTLSYSTVDPDHTTSRSCHYAVGQAVVARYHAVLDDGRTLIVIDDCG